jgi:hypothetical protein
VELVFAALRAQDREQAVESVGQHGRSVGRQDRRWGSLAG